MHHSLARALTVSRDDSIDCSSFATCQRCTLDARCRFCGIACIRANTSCPAQPNVAFGESAKCSEPVTAACPVSQSCSSCRQWPTCQHCEGSGCISQALPCPGGIAVPSGGTCPIRIAHGAAVTNVTLAANMTRAVVVVLNSGSFRVGVAPASLSAVTGGVNGSHVIVDARALDTGPLGAEADVVAPLFASLGASLSNVAALRIVAPDCLAVSNATLGVAGQLIVALFHVTMRTPCTSTSPAPPSSTISLADTSSLTLTSVQPTDTLPTSIQSTSAPPSTSVTDTQTQTSTQLAVTNQSTSTDSSATATIGAATPSDQAAWILPVAVTAAALTLLAGVGVAALLWKRKRTAATNQGAEMVTARAEEEPSVRPTGDYGVLPGAHTMSNYATQVSEFRIADNSPHYELLASPAETDTANGPQADEPPLVVGE